MHIESIHAHIVKIPFRFSIDHNLKRRTSTEALVIALETDDGLCGYGEGAPRNYVTGESIQDLFHYFQRHARSWSSLRIQGIEDIESYCDRIPPQMPSLRCAVEMALLDAWGKHLGWRTAELLPGNATNHTPYSGVLPYLAPAEMAKWLIRIAELKLPHIKMKVGGSHDFDNLTLARDILGPNVDLRIDANRSWSLQEATTCLQKWSLFNISCVEEPLVDDEIHLLPELSREVATPLMLDESVHTLAQAQCYAEHISSEALKFNLKISKCGGLLGASEIHRFATSNGISCQLGCNVGETAILSMAGRHFASTHALEYLEGCYGSFFMDDDLTAETPSFSIGGVGKPLTGAGLGIHVLLEKLHRYSETHLPSGDPSKYSFTNKLIQS